MSSSINAPENCGLHHLVEAATALTQLVSSVPPSNKPSSSSSNHSLSNAHAISDDEDSKKDTYVHQVEQALNQNANSVGNGSKGASSQEQELKSSPNTKLLTSVDTKTITNVSLSSSSPSQQLRSQPQPQPQPQQTPQQQPQPCPREIFPQRLMRILSDTSITDIITWLPHGRSFVIVQPEALAEKILPAYFPESCTTSPSSGSKGSPSTSTSTCKYPSFTRKLNRWGFRQVTRGPDAGAFHHKFFRRDDPSQCRQMICQRSRRRKVDDSRNNVVSILPRGILPRTVTADLGINNNSGYQQHGPQHHPATTVKARPLPTMQNYRTKSPPVAQTQHKHPVTMGSNVSSNIISTNTSPAHQRPVVNVAPVTAAATNSRAPHVNVSVNAPAPGPATAAASVLQQHNLGAHASVLLQQKLAMNAMLSSAAAAANAKQQQQPSQVPAPGVGVVAGAGAPVNAPAPVPPPTLPSLYTQAASQQVAAASLLAPLLQQAQVAHQPNLAYMLQQHHAAARNQHQLPTHAAAAQAAARTSPTHQLQQHNFAAKPATSVGNPIPAATVAAIGTGTTTSTNANSATSTSQTSIAPTPVIASVANTANDTAAGTVPEAKKEMTAAELRLENAKSMLYSAYLKALG